MFYFFFNWGPPFYTQKGRADPTKRCLYCVFFRQGNPWSKPLCSSSYRSVHLPFCQIWFFICSFFEGATMISFYLLSIFLSSYLVFLQCFCSIYVSFQHIDMLVFWLFCLCLPMLLLCFFCLSVLLSFHPSVYVTIYFLYYWSIDISMYLVICLSFPSICLCVYLPLLLPTFLRSFFLPVDVFLAGVLSIGLSTYGSLSMFFLFMIPV